MLVAIDPGWEQSAYVIYDGEKPIAFKIIDNDAMLAFIRGVDADALVIEQVACMGMAVGAEIFETVFWSGRFAEAWAGKWDRVKRHEVKMHLCGNMRAKDANIRTAIIDRYGPGKDKAIGRKKSPGPLFGLSGDCWSALAVAITWTETKSP
jgi:hypothetical protein